MFSIGNKKIGKNYPVFIIAEAGINHNGDINIAKKLIKEASNCGADAVKFQTIITDELFSKKLNPELYELVNKWVLSKRDHLILMDYAKKNKIEFFSTPMGKKTTKLLVSLNISAIKIASGDLDYHEFLKYVAKTKSPMIISTGMSKISEIASAVEIIKSENCKFALLHCNSSYPTPIEDANLSTIPYLQKMFDVPIGYSDHTDGIDACIGAVALGANILEKHFTLDKEMDGPDQKLSADPKEFSELIRKTRFMEKALGKPRSNITKSEQKFVKRMRKSIGVSKNIPAKTKITKSMLTAFRPGNGISPTMIEHIVGLKTKKAIDKDTQLSWDMF
ncbi:MAG: N-acetylneuraminate synthase [Thaumarchaeota archaeon]|jgi:N-acetylneuraminate synthase/N,N'-diacetyllegionaminate synthase|nr:MAG: N-acetylneuraminate synthase [Nitrososphaerota archaeon]